MALCHRKGGFCGNRCLKLNMTACGKGGVLMRFMGPMG
jgi:hypothetical protein